jgi:chemotaxis protein MotB
MSGTGSGSAPALDPNQQQLQELKEKLEREIQARKDLEKLNKQIEMTITSEGLRIELLEDKNGTFYQSGSAKLSPSGQELLALLARELKTLPNQLQIEGHTDAAQYSNDANYSNWELSADRANSARRLLQQDGVRADQVTQVRGYADQLLRVKSNPYDPSNRRISILVKNNDNAPPPPLVHARVVDGAPGPAAGAPAKPAASQPPPASDLTNQHPSMQPGAKKP